MANSKAAMQAEIDDLQETLGSVSDLVDEALDPQLSREDVIAKVKEISDLVSPEEEGEEEDEGEEEGEE